MIMAPEDRQPQKKQMEFVLDFHGMELFMIDLLYVTMFTERITKIMKYV